MEDRLRIMLVALLAVTLGSGPARAYGIVLDLDPSIRAAGAGGGNGAVFWGGDANSWANPALLAYGTGVRFDRTHTHQIGRAHV